MALKIRLRQQGCANRQTYRVVVADVRTRRDGKYIEKLGWYLPHLAENNCSINADRMEYWLLQGAQMSEQVESLAAKHIPQALQSFKQAKELVYRRKVEKKREKKQAKTA